MVGGRFRCLSCFTYTAVLLLGVCVLNAEASTCDRIVHKKVGDTVVLPSCLNEPVEEVTIAKWTYKERTVAEKGQNVTQLQFMGRTDLNPKDFNLTVRKLTRQDSGDFSFLSDVNEIQRPTVTITLQVHEPVIKQPDLMINSTWIASNGSCTVFLECSSVSDIGVTYSWAVRNQTQSGSKLQYNFSPEDGETTFTCTVSNTVSGMSASKTVKCSNSTSQPQETGNFIFVLVGAVGGGLVFVIIVIAVVVCHCKQRQAGSDSDDLTVYADITDVAVDGTMKPYSVYETIDNAVAPVTTGPHTVYDKIQLSRVRKPSVSPYQDVS